MAVILNYTTGAANNLGCHHVIALVEDCLSVNVYQEIAEGIEVLFYGVQRLTFMFCSVKLPIMLTVA